jgi:hypothetical protein
MADKIAGVPKRVLIIGGAVAAGVLAYAYWKNGSASPTAVDPGEYSGESDYESPLGNTGTNSSGSFPGTVDPEAINTNAQWTSAAVEALQSAGWEASAVYVALGKLLAFKELSAAEVQIAQAAKAAVGEPPQGGPYPIKEAIPTPSAPGGPTPTGSRGYGWHQVRKGDSWATFAKSHGISVADLFKYNSMASLNRLTVGEWLRTRYNSNPTSGFTGN